MQQAAAAEGHNFKNFCENIENNFCENIDTWCKIVYFVWLNLYEG